MLIDFLSFLQKPFCRLNLKQLYAEKVKLVINGLSHDCTASANTFLATRCLDADWFK